MTTPKICLQCNKKYEKPYEVGAKLWATRKYCSTKCVAESKTGEKRPPFSQDWKDKISKAKLGKLATTETKIKMSIARTGKGNSMYGKSGILSPVWIENRDEVVIIPNQERRSNPYLFWRKSVCNRDNWKCRIENKDCNGKLEVHHILGFKAHPELRYDINNGITLCHFHHPRKRSEEANLSPFFQKLVAELK